METSGYIDILEAVAMGLDQFERDMVELREAEEADLPAYNPWGSDGMPEPEYDYTLDTEPPGNPW